jgi:hypothetical protein
MKQHNRAGEGVQTPFRAEVPARPKNTCTKCSPGDLAWQQKREDSDKKCIAGGSGGQRGTNPSSNGGRRSSVGARHVRGVPDGKNKKTIQAEKNRVLEWAQEARVGRKCREG